MATPLRGVIDFFGQIGLYDVVLPFILVFSIVFAVLEKTQIFGMEEVEGKKYTRKNINVMVAFVMSFFVVASSKLVEIITEVSSNIVILLMLAILFLLLVGSFYKEGEGSFLQGGWKTFFTFIMFIGIIFIFLNALHTDSGDTWLDVFWDFVSEGSGGNAVGSVILIIVIVLLMVYIVKEPGNKDSSK